MLSVTTICVGKLNEKFYTDAVAEFSKRLGGYCRLEIIEVPEYRTHDTITIGHALKKESAGIERKIPPGSFSVALCIEGKQIDSHGLSELLEDCAGRGASRLCFIIGGSHGLHDDVKNNADLKLSMSKMTFPHSLARVMLLEQLYRAFMIAGGGKYHK